MSAKLGNRLLSDKRTELGRVVPLEKPYVLLIDPSSICNLRCKFCPTGNEMLIKKTNREQKIMEFDLYKKVIDDAKDFSGKIKTLRLYKEGEPLVNPNFSKMVDYARKTGQFEKIDTTTNGVLLNSDLNSEITKTNIDQINISVNGITSAQIYKYTRRNIDFETYVNNVRDLYEKCDNTKIYIKAIKDLLSEEEQEIFLNTFGEISHKIYLERLSPAWPDFVFEDIGMDFSTGHYGQKIENRSICPYLFYILVVNSDGTVSTCVGDWKHNQLLGDLKISSLKDIWNGDVIKEYWIKHALNKRHLYPMCSKCSVITHGSLDNLDKYASEIIERINLK